MHDSRGQNASCDGEVEQNNTVYNSTQVVISGRLQLYMRSDKS